MNSSGIPDLVGMIRTMMSAYTPYMLLAPFLVTNFKQGLQLIGDGLNGSQRRSASLLGMAITCFSLSLGWSSYCSLLICVGQFMHGASLDAQIQSIKDLPQALLWFVDLSPWPQPSPHFDTTTEPGKNPFPINASANFSISGVSLCSGMVGISS